MYERALDRTRKVVGGVGRDQLDDPTPCTDWKVRDVLNHLINGAKAFAAGGRGEKLDFNSLSDNTSGDYVAAFESATDDALKVFREPDAQEKQFTMSWGDSPYAACLGLAIADAAVHGWDLAKGTDQEATIDDDIAEAVYAMTSSMMEPKGQMPRGKSFAPPVEVEEDASSSDRALAYLGRTP
jgi:uncharacterized protein (TIGR03086 family)